MLFLLVTLLANHGDASCHSHAYRLQSAIKQELGSQAFLAITRYRHPRAHARVHLPGRGGIDARHIPSRSCPWCNPVPRGRGAASWIVVGCQDRSRWCWQHGTGDTVQNVPGRLGVPGQLSVRVLVSVQVTIPQCRG